MKSRVQQAFIAIAIIFALIGCKKDVIDDTTDWSGYEGYGTDLVIELPDNFSSKFPLETVVCEIRTPLGTVVTINALHVTTDEKSALILEEPLMIGTNLLRSVEYTGILSDGTRSSNSTTFAMGCNINVDEFKNEIHTKIYNSLYELFGSGTADDPYFIASALNVASINEMESTNSLHFRQVDDLDFSAYYGHEYGFDGICPDFNNPFRGTFYVDETESFSIKNLAVRKFTAEQESQSVDLGTTTSAGFFGCVANATITNLIVEDPDLSGDEAVGGIVGMILGISCADSDAQTKIDNCHVKRTIGSTDNGNKIFGTSCVGGIVGCVEYEGAASILNCSVAKDIVLGIRSYEYDGAYLGGILGAGGLAGEISISNCENHASISGDGANGIGGIVGAAQAIKLVNCINNGDVTATSISSDYLIGAGGLIGSSTEATIIASTNNGAVIGDRGVGGIIGSAVFDADEAAMDENNSDVSSVLYGNITIASSINNGAVSGAFSVGGLAGEGQLNFSHCYNSGAVSQIASNYGGSYSSDDNVCIGGLAGFASAIVANGAHNSGSVTATSGSSRCGGVAGHAEYFFLYGCSNFGDIKGNHAGGILGKTCDYGIMNYVANYATIEATGSSGSQYTAGGLVGSLGEHLSASSKWSAFGKDVEKDFAMAFLKIGVEGGMGAWAKMFKAESKVSTFIACCGSAGELLEIADEIAMGIYGSQENDEEVEELEKLCEEYSEFVEESITTNNTTIESTIDNLIASGKYKYNGALSGSINSDLAQISFKNIKGYTAMIDTGLSTMTFDDDGVESTTSMTDLTVNSINDLYEIGEDNYSRALAMEIANVVVKCALAVISGGTVVGFEVAEAALKVTKKAVKAVKLITAAASTTGAVVMDATKEFTADEENVIIVNQGMNFGTVTNGNGLVGMLGDRIAIRNSLSAGNADHYAIASDADGKNIAESGILCIGKENQKPYSDKGFGSGDLSEVYGYGDGTDGTSSLSELKDSGNYGSSWSWKYWDMSQTNGEIPLPFDSPYLSFQ